MKLSPNHTFKVLHEDHQREALAVLGKKEIEDVVWADTNDVNGYKVSVVVTLGNNALRVHRFFDMSGEIAWSLDTDIDRDNIIDRLTSRFV